MKIGLVGPSYVERSLPFDAQRTINLFPVINETQRGKEISALYGTPGLELFATAGIGPIRGVFCSANGRAFVVSATQLYELSSNGTATLRGTLTSDATIVTMDENFTQMGICDGTDLYTLTYATNTFAKVTDTDFPGGSTVTYLDGYFIVNKPDSGEFYISALNDGTAWDALDFATAESSPDGLIRVFAALGQLWLFGEQTTEVWYNSADVDFPFDKVQGAKIETGCAAAHSVCSLDNSVFWLGRNKDGQGIVYRASGYSPQRISTHAIEYAINQSTDLSDIRAYTYQQDGHTFYCLTGGDLATTLVYDAATQLWHERANLETDGTYSTHKASSCMYAFNKHIVGDKTNGNVYRMSLDITTDAGQEIRRQRVFTHLSNEAKRFRARELQIDFENSTQQIAPTTYIKSMQDFEITIATGATSGTVTIDAVNTAYAVVFPAGTTTTSTSTDYRDFSARTTLTNATTLTATRDGASTGTIVVRGSLVEFDASMVNSVQYGTITVSPSATAGTATITAVGTRAVVIPLGFSCTSITGVNHAMTRLDLTNTTTVTATRGSSNSSTITASYCVVDFTATAVSSVQQRNIALLGTSLAESDSITPVNTGRTILIDNGCASTTTAARGRSHRYELTGTSVVSITRESTTGLTRNVGFTVVEFQPGILEAIRRGSLQLDSIASDEETINSVVSERAFIQLTGYSTNTNTGYDAILPALTLEGDTTIEAVKATAGSVSSTPGYEVIQFARTVPSNRVWLEVSDDFGRTWSPEYHKSIGGIGEYKARAVWRRMGTSDALTFRVTMADPIKAAICGAYLK